MAERISSLQNPKIKHIVKLTKASERKKYAEFVIEGIREIELAISAGYEIKSIFYEPEIVLRNKRYDLIKKLESKAEIYELGSEAFSKIAYREGTEGFLAIAAQKLNTLGNLFPGKNPLFLIIESVEKPGNLGAILRTADAAALDGVIVCDPLTDIYNPNLIRSSLGCVFTVPIAICSSREAYDFMIKHEVKIFATTLQCNSNYQDEDFTGPCSFVMGTEATGLSGFWREKAFKEIKIPMLGMIDSLNVATASAIFVFEALRQRKFKA